MTSRTGRGGSPSSTTPEAAEGREPSSGVDSLGLEHLTHTQPHMDIGMQSEDAGVSL